MSVRYGEVERMSWRTILRDLSDEARLVWMALRTGPITTSLDGLVETDALMLSSVLNRPLEYARRGLSQLVEAGLVEVDERYSLVRLAGVPGPEDPIKSYLQLKGWWANWQQLPPSPLKFAHVATLRHACDLSVPGKQARGKNGEPYQIPSMIEIWEKTFGTLKEAVDRLSQGGCGGPDQPPLKPDTDSRLQIADSRLQIAEVKKVIPPAEPAAPQAPSVAKKKTAARKRPEQPLPFRAARAAELVAAAAGEHFVLPPTPIAAGHAIAIEKAIRAFPREEQWTALGQYLAAGNIGWIKDAPGVPWLASALLPDSLTRAVAWAEAGRPAKAAAAPPARPGGFSRPSQEPVGDAYEESPVLRRRREQREEQEEQLRRIEAQGLALTRSRR